MAAAAVVGLMAAVPRVQALQAGPIASVSPHDTLAGSNDTRISVTVSSLSSSIDAVRVVRPDGLFTVLGGSASGWTPTNSPGASVTFTGGLVLPGHPGHFVVEVATSRPGKDVFGQWQVLTSSDGGQTFHPAQGAGNTSTSLAGNVRVLAMTNATISPAEGSGTVVTAGSRVMVTTIVTNLGVRTIRLSPSACYVSGDEAGDITSGGTYLGRAAVVAPGKSVTVRLYGVMVGSNTGSGRHIRTTVAGNKGDDVQASVDVVTIAPPNS